MLLNLEKGDTSFLESQAECDLNLDENKCKDYWEKKISEEVSENTDQNAGTEKNYIHRRERQFKIFV